MAKDGGFKMPPPQRKEPSRFEPPPWEKEAFEELERRKAAGEERSEAVVPATEEPAADVPLEKRVPEVTKTPGDCGTDGSGVAAEQGKPNGATLPVEAVLIEMLSELRDEEPSSQNVIHGISIGVAIALLALGAVLVIWGMAGIVGSRFTGTIGLAGGAVLLTFGAGFVALALWLVTRTLRQRGVL